MRFREDRYKISVKARLFSNSAGRFSFSKIKTKQFDYLFDFVIFYLNLLAIKEKSRGVQVKKIVIKLER